MSNSIKQVEIDENGQIRVLTNIGDIREAAYHIGEKIREGSDNCWFEDPQDYLQYFVFTSALMLLWVEHM